MARPTQVGLGSGWSLRQAVRVTGVAPSVAAAVKNSPPLSENDITDGDLLSLKLLSVVDGFRDDVVWGPVPETLSVLRAREIHRAAQTVWSNRMDDAVIVVARTACWLASSQEEKVALLEQHSDDAVIVLPVGTWCSDLRTAIEATRGAA